MLKIPLKNLTAVILLMALVLRLQYFMYALVYDEIWTLNNFAGLGIMQLLFDLELPNNHPLNSLYCKLLMNLSDTLPDEAVRLAALAAGMGSVVLAGVIARIWFKKTPAMLWSMFFTAFSAPLICYSVQARGYALQVFFLLLYVYSILKSSAAADGRKSSIFPALLIVISGVCAMLSLPTSALYLAAATVILWNCNNWKLPDKKTLYTIISAGVLSLLYLLVNMRGLLAARQWGSEVSGIGSYFCWLGNTLLYVLPWALLPWAGWGFYTQRRYWAGFAAAAVLIFGSAALTNAGPSRVYQVLAVFFAMLGGGAASDVFERLKNKKYLPVIQIAGALLIVCNSYYQQQQIKFINYYDWVSAADALPSGTLAVYPAADTYPLYFAGGEKLNKKYQEELGNGSDLRKLLLVNMDGGSITGVCIEREFAPETLPLKHTGRKSFWGKSIAYEFDLQKTEKVSAATGSVIVIVCAADRQEYDSCIKKLLAATVPEKRLLLNLFLRDKRFFRSVFFVAAGGWKQELVCQNDHNLSAKMIFYQIVP